MLMTIFCFMNCSYSKWARTTNL